MVAVAKGKARSAQAAGWLERLAAEGADVVLVTDASAQYRPSATSPLRKFRPFLLARAIEAEHQLRPIDVLVPTGPAERLALCCVPRFCTGSPGFGSAPIPGR